MRGMFRLLLAAAWGLTCFIIGGYLIQLGTTRHGNYEAYGFYVVLSWIAGVVGMLAIASFRRR